MPFLEALHKKHGGSGLVIVGVSVDSDRSNADKLIRDRCWRLIARAKRLR